jgi:hypothetical protein
VTAVTAVTTVTTLAATVKAAASETWGRSSGFAECPNGGADPRDLRTLVETVQNPGFFLRLYLWVLPS